MSKASDLYDAFGVSNIRRWANLDNIADDYPTTPALEVDARIEWANKAAEQEVFNRLVRGRYNLANFDVQGGTNPVPYMSTLIAAYRAGMFLYDGRRVVSSSDDTDEISQQRKDYDRWIYQVKAGILKFTDPSDKTKALKLQTGEAPGVVA